MKTIQEAQSETVFYVENGSVITSNLYDYLSDFGQGDDTSAIEESEQTLFTVDGTDFENEDDALEFCEEHDIPKKNIEEKTITNYTHVVRYHANYGRKIKSKGWPTEDKEEAVEKIKTKS